jgi:PAS domain S-box-containing protein
METLRSECPRLTLILDAMEDGVYVVNRDYDIEYVNPALKREFGEPAGMKCYQYFHGGQEVCPWCRNPEVFAGATVRWEWRSPKTGKTYDLVDTPLRNPDGSISKLEIFRDITDRKAAEEALRVSEEQFRFAITQAAVPVMMVAEDGQILALSDVVRALTGYGREQLRRLEDVVRLLRGARAGESERRLEQLFGQGCALEPAEITILTRRGEERTWITSAAAPQRLRDGRQYGVIFATDITDHKRAEEALSEARKLESVGVLARGLAHDFNNLLTALAGNANLALESLAAAHPARANVEAVIRISERAAGLVRQMLAFAGQGRIAVEPHNLSAVVSELASLLAASLPEKTELKLSLAPDLPAVQADGNQLQQLLMNLVINAGEAIGPRTQGTVSLTTALRNIEATAALLDFAGEKIPSGSYVCLEVSDTGCGLNAADVRKIFDPFFTTKSIGRGLGLSAVAGIVRRHRGAVQVRNAPGKGCAFTVYLPAAPSETGPPEQTSGNRTRSESTRP